MIKKLFEFLKKLFSKKEPCATNTESGQTQTEYVNAESGDTYTAGGDGENTTETVNSASTETIGADKPVVVEPVPNEQPKSDIKVLIDNGHGYDTPGKRSPWCANKVKPEIEFYEYKWNREIAKMIVDNLIELGYDASLIVTEDKDISLSERANRVNKVCKEVGTSNVIFISIHANAAGNGAAWMTGRGWCAYTTKGQTKSDTLAEFIYKEAEKNFVGHKIRKDTTDGDSDWEANFTVIYKSLCPSVLTENFFYDNVDDVNYILSDEGKAAVVKTHVDGIINYISQL